MALYVLRRLLLFIPALWVVVTLVFFLVRLAPGGPFDDEKAFSPEVRERIEAHYNLNAPLWKQYLLYWGGLFRGDLGPSLTKPSRTVVEWVLLRFPVSLELGCWALLVAMLVGCGAGLLASLKPNSWLDHGAMSFAMIGICVPAIVLGPLLVLIFAIRLEWLPVQGWYFPEHRILPAITLGLAYAAYFARLLRGGMREVLFQDFIRTARAKGLKAPRIIFRHALRSGAMPVVTFLGPAAAGLLTGSFVVESIFQIPGLGREFIVSALNRDYTMTLGTVIVFAVLILLFNLLVDLLLAWMDPRCRKR